MAQTKTTKSGNSVQSNATAIQGRTGIASPAVKTTQLKENKTGLPDELKSGVESLSGMSMDGVKVHRNSDSPKRFNAHAYAQGEDIHVGPGQEKHLPHEAWHVVQQKQGRVKPTMQMKGKLPVNDDMQLEREADVMGAKALNTPAAFAPKQTVTAQSNTVQRKITAVGSADNLKYLSDKTGEYYDSREAAEAAEKARLNHPGLSAFANKKASMLHKLDKMRGKGGTLLERQNAALDSGAVAREQGVALRAAGPAIKGAAALAKVGAGAAGAALAGPAGMALAMGIKWAIGKAEKMAAAKVKDRMEERAAQSYAVLGGAMDEQRQEIGDASRERMGQPEVEEDAPAMDEMVIKDESKRAAVVAVLKKAGKKFKGMAEQEIKDALEPQKIDASLLADGDPLTIANSLLWEGIKRALAEGHKLAEKRLDSAKAGADAVAYRGLVDEED